MAMNETSKSRIQTQLRQFLKDYRNMNNLSADQAAELLGVEIATYRTLEGNKTTNRVLSALEHLEKYAALNKWSLTTFVTFLERNGRTESGSNQIKRTLYEWERELLERFDMVGIPLRNRFMRGLKGVTDAQVKEILTGLTQLISMPENERQALFNLIREMKNNA